MLRPYGYNHGETVALDLASGFDTQTHRLRRLAQATVAELVVLHARYFDVDVNAVQQRAGDALLVLGHRAGGAGAGLDRVSVITARIGIHTM